MKGKLTRAVDISAKYLRHRSTDGIDSWNSRDGRNSGDRGYAGQYGLLVLRRRTCYHNHGVLDGASGGSESSTTGNRVDWRRWHWRGCPDAAGGSHRHCRLLRRRCSDYAIFHLREVTSPRCSHSQHTGSVRLLPAHRNVHAFNSTHSLLYITLHYIARTRATIRSLSVRARDDRSFGRSS